MKVIATVVVLAAIGTVPSAFAQTPGINHDAASCIVAGKYPKLRACFTTPDVAKSRVYFRREDRPIWYHVEMTEDAQCFVGILPRPTKALVGKKVLYYVEVASRNLDVGRTEEHAPRVVGTQADCGDQLVAPYMGEASVSVFPEMPPGFTAGGLGTAGIAGGAAAVVGIGAGVWAGRDKATSPGTGPAPAPPSTPTVTPPPPPPPPPPPRPRPPPPPRGTGAGLGTPAEAGRATAAPAPGARPAAAALAGRAGPAPPPPVPGGSDARGPTGGAAAGPRQGRPPPPPPPLLQPPPTWTWPWP
jgi:hypothetical protein